MNQKKAKQLKLECSQIALECIEQGLYQKERALAAKNLQTYRFNLVNRLKKYHIRNLRLGIVSGRILKTQSGRYMERKASVRKSSVHQMFNEK